VDSPNQFTLKVFDVLRAIPRGRVATYQQVAGLAGKIHASRGVAWILNSCSKKYKLPWQRVINSQGRISFRPGTSHFLLQRRMLQSEGVAVNGKNGAVDMGKFQYKKKPRKPRPKKNQPRMFS
jgi:methylated-DNA-protein-cysteine methyltransferase-like protein